MATTTDDKKIIYSMDRVSRSYGTKTVLKDISISYYYGAKIGVIGANGSGKSTIIDALSIILTCEPKKFNLAANKNDKRNTITNSLICNTLT